MFRQIFTTLLVVAAIFLFGVQPSHAYQTDQVGVHAARFVDVPDEAYFSYPVQWLVDNNITTGTSATTYSPDRRITRGEMAAFLWRLAGKPVSATSCGFTDVPSGTFYSGAVCWLVANKITNGTSTTTYSPGRDVTRGEMAAFLWRAAGNPASPTPHHFEDVPNERYFEVPVRWLRSHGITVGVGNPYRYSPDSFVTRGQMAAFLWRSNYAGESQVVLSSLKVEEEDRTGYDRDIVFSSWKDLDRNGCNTRCEVLAEEKRFDLPGFPNGGWFSVFDSVSTDNASTFDIDHMIPLAEAWDSGGKSWSPEKWVAFGNDLDDPRSLRAVSASSNRSKSDRDPAEWMPPTTSFRCQYTAEWVALKSRWSLSVDTAEQNALTQTLTGCPGTKALVQAAPQQ